MSSTDDNLQSDCRYINGAGDSENNQGGAKQAEVRASNYIVEIIWFLTVKVRSFLQWCYEVSFRLLENSVICRLRASF